jgi:hypothetical protein
VQKRRWVGYSQFKALGFVNPSTGEPFSRVHLQRMMRRGQHPLAHEMSPNCVAWDYEEMRRRYDNLPIARSLQGATAEAAE